MILHLNQSKQANKETESLEKLIAGCRSGDSCNQFQMFHSLAPKMRVVINRYIKNVADAEDILVIGLTRVLLKIETYQGIGSFEGLAKKIVTNLALSTLAQRTHQQRNVYLTDLDAYDPSYQISEIDHLIQALESLPEYLSKPFILFSIEGYSHKEIGRQLSISETLSRVRVLRAKRLMQERLLRREQILKKPTKYLNFSYLHKKNEINKIPYHTIACFELCKFQRTNDLLEYRELLKAVDDLL